MSDGAAITGVITAVAKQHGRLDAVVLSAGVVAYGRFEDVPPEVLDAGRARAEEMGLDGGLRWTQELALRA